MNAIISAHEGNQDAAHHAKRGTRDGRLSAVGDCVIRHGMRCAIDLDHDCS